MRNDFRYPSSDGETMIRAAEWRPDGEVRAVLQLCHGMTEHILRYEPFAEYLNAFGYVVVGNDHLGHGESVTEDSRHGWFGKNGNEHLIADIDTLRRMTEEKYPGVPYLMLGHSMGSFLIRQYMMCHGAGLAGVIVMGTGGQPKPVVIAGKTLCRLIAIVHGWEYRSKFMTNMAFSAYNKAFEPARTPQDWLTKDEAIVDRYRADPWCMFTFTLNGYYEMFRGIRFIGKKKNIAKTPASYPILFVSGGDDPVGDSGRGVRAVFDAYRRAGLHNVTMKLYPHDRHEILNETDRETVFEDLRLFLDTAVKETKTK